MKTNYRPDRVAFIDFETWSTVPLKSRARYVANSTVLCAVMRVDGVSHVNPSRELMAQVAADRVMVAHNAPFDSAIWSSLGLPDVTWCDTLPMARAAGLPGKLDLLGMRLEGRGKNAQGKQVLDLFIKSKVLPPRHLPIYGILEAYCERDVELLETVFNVVKGFGEVDVMTADRALNDRGVPVDREYLQALHDIMEQNSDEARERVTKHFNPKSPKQVKEWLVARGYDVASVGAEALKEFDFSDDVDDVLDDRREVMRVGLSKAKEGLASLDDDDRLRDQFAYWASLPGRWASYGLQLHNMPKSIDIDVRAVEMTMPAVRAYATAHKCRVSDVTNGALRHCVRTPNMLVADFAAVEPRMLAWLADDRDMLAVYNDPKKNAYLEMGKKIFGKTITKKDEIEYFISKQIVIACGYGMGHVKFDATLLKFGVDASTIPGGARYLVQTFRKTCPRIVDLWRAYDNAAMTAVKYGMSNEIGKVSFHMSHNTLIITLPSGRPILYRNARIERTVPAYKAMYGLPLTLEDTICYDHPMFGRRELYGGKITENVDQGACRDLLAHAMVNLERAGYEPFMHAHDEVAGQRGEFKEFMEIVSTPPAWALDFPLGAEGYQGPLWAKEFSGWTNAKYLRGQHVG